MLSVKFEGSGYKTPSLQGASVHEARLSGIVRRSSLDIVHRYLYKDPGFPQQPPGGGAPLK